MKNDKIIIKIIVIFLLIAVIIAFNYFIYMFVKEKTVTLPNSINYSKKELFDISKDYVESFCNYLKAGKYENAYEMLHERSQIDLFSAQVAQFTDLMKTKYFNGEQKYKTFEIRESSKDNISEKNLFHAYYDIKILCSNEVVKDTSLYYKDRIIYADVVKVEEGLKIVLSLEEDKIEKEETNKEEIKE